MMLLFLPVWPCQKQKANASTMNNFAIWFAAESSEVDSQGQNTKSISQTIQKKEQRPKEGLWHSAKIPSISFAGNSKFALRKHFINL